MPTVLRIKDWDRIFEDSSTKKVLKNPTWMKMPLKRGAGYRRLLRQTDGGTQLGTALFGAWVAFAEFAMECFVRGVLIRRDGKPYKPIDINIVTDVPVPILEQLISLLLDPDQEIHWLEEIPLEDALRLIEARERTLAEAERAKKHGRHPDTSETNPDALNTNAAVTEPHSESSGKYPDHIRKNGEKSSLKEKRVEEKTEQKTNTSPSSSQSAQQPVRTSTGEPATWAEVAEAMKSLKISRREQTMKAAQRNGFNPAQVLAIIDYLVALPAEACESPAGALCDRLGTEDAADWDCNENWPWSGADKPESSSLYDVPSEVQQENAKRLEAESLERSRKFAADVERRELMFGAALNAMSFADHMALIGTAPPANRELLTRDYQAKGRDSPDVRPELLRLLEAVERKRGGHDASSS